MKILKFLLTAVALLLWGLTMHAQQAQYQRGYTKSNGTYVQSHYKTSPNGTNTGNYSRLKVAFNIPGLPTKLQSIP